jgi:hypothetical protein
MTISVKATDVNGQPLATAIDRYPDICPFCNLGGHPQVYDAFVNGQGHESNRLQLVCRCPRARCGLTYLALYEGYPSIGPFNYKGFIHGRPVPPSIPDSVKLLSPAFADIFQDAAAAEYYHLENAAGPTYRKALEFLVKDFIIKYLKPTDASQEQIERMKLGNCIERFLEDPVTKATAKRAAWLGNDETHYERLFKDKDLEDLKKLLTIAVHGIDSRLVADDYVKAMSSKK